MPINVYVMPAIGTGATPEDARRPKYVNDLVTAAVSYAAMDYGNEPVYLVAVKDPPSSLQTTLAGYPDVIAVPDLQQNVGAQLTTVHNRLESLNIPGQWVTSGMSYGSVCRYTAVIFLVVQVLTQRLGRPRIFGGAITLSTAWNQLSTTVRQDLLDLAAELQFNTTGMSGNTQIRQILVALADQWPAVSIPFGGVVL